MHRTAVGARPPEARSTRAQAAVSLSYGANRGVIGANSRAQAKQKSPGTGRKALPGAESLQTSSQTRSCGSGPGRPIRQTAPLLDSRLSADVFSARIRPFQPDGSGGLSTRGESCDDYEDAFMATTDVA